MFTMIITQQKRQLIRKKTTLKKYSKQLHRQTFQSFYAVDDKAKNEIIATVFNKYEYEKKK